MAPSAGEIARLRSEIRDERARLARVLQEAGEVLVGGKVGKAPYALALLLHNYYTGAEKVFERVARLFGGVPAGERWRLELLEDMAIEISAVRPAVVSRETVALLQPYLGLRHVIRNMYAFALEWEELALRAGKLPAVHAALEADLDRFDGFLAAAGAE